MANFCPNCGAQLGDGLKFCPSCGTQIVAAGTPVQAEQPPAPLPGVVAAQPGPPGKFARFTGIFTAPFGGFVFAALLCAGFLPWLLQAALVMLRGNLLPAIAPVLLRLLGAALAFVFAALAEMRRRNVKLRPAAFGSAAARIFLGGGGTAMAVVALFAVARALLRDFVSGLDQPLLAAGITWGMHLLECLLVALFAVQALRGSPKKTVPVMLLSGALLLLGCCVVPQLFVWFPWLLRWTGASFTGLAAQWLILLPLQWVFVQCAFALWLGGEEIPDKKPNKAFGLAGAVALAGACVALLVTTAAFNPAKVALRQVTELLDQGDFYLKEDDYAWASAYYTRANARREVWLAALEGKEDLTRAAREYDYDEAVHLLLLGQSDAPDTVRELYFELLTEDCPAQYYVICVEKLRALIAEANERDQERYRSMLDDVLLACVTRGIFTGRLATPEILSDRQKETLRKELLALDDAMAEGLSACIVNKLALNGDVMTEELAKEAVALAERYPDNLEAQWTGARIGSLYTADSIQTFYARVIEAAMRYDKLWFAENPKATAEEAVTIKANIAYILYARQTNGAKEKVKQYLDDALAKYDSDELRLTYAAAMYHLRDFDASAALADELCQKDPENLRALGCAMMARAMMNTKNKPSEALDRALALSAAARKDVTDASGAGKLLVAYAQGKAGYYAGIRQGFPHLYFSAEDSARLAEDPLLDSLVQALDKMKGYKAERDDNAALSHIDDALAIMPGWPILQYLKGNLLYQLGRYGEALTWYEKSVSGDPGNAGTWFMLGNTYDQLGRYHEAAAAYRQVLTFSPKSDHTLDHWGFSYHSIAAMDALRKHLWEEELQ